MHRCTRSPGNPHFASVAVILFFQRVRCATNTTRVRVSSRNSRNGPGGIHAVGSVPFRCNTFIPCVSSLSLLLTCPIINFALRGCTSRGTHCACSISSVIQYQLAVASIATAVPAAQPAKASRIAPGACSTRYCRTFPVLASQCSTHVYRL
jgi:hypothetical protein